MRGSSAVSRIEAGLAARSLTRDELSLALIDARNRTLRWLALFEAAGQLFGGSGADAVPIHLAGHAGWLQEWWIGRNVQRLRGMGLGSGGLRLASIEPVCDRWFGGEPIALRDPERPGPTRRPRAVTSKPPWIRRSTS